VGAQVNWPEWWEWELEIDEHVESRMEDRDFDELDLREMLESATGFSRNWRPGRWHIHTRWRRGKWTIVVEPDPEAQRLAVVTAFPLE